MTRMPLTPHASHHSAPSLNAGHRHSASSLNAVLATTAVLRAAVCRAGAWRAGAWRAGAWRAGAWRAAAWRAGAWRAAACRAAACGAACSGALLLSSSSAAAHVSIAEPAFAGSRSVVTFSIGHGCEGADTVRLEVGIPSEVTTLRGMPSADFGAADVVTDEAGLPIAVIWSKDSARPQDDAFYELSVRITVPATPFTSLYFPATQTCRNAEGEETIVEWAALPGAPLLDGGIEPEPAPALIILPPHSPGWNKFTAEDDITDLSVFDNAEIVWVGDEAYSGNPVTAELIASEPGVTPLIDIQAGAEVWIKY